MPKTKNGINWKMIALLAGVVVMLLGAILTHLQVNKVDKDVYTEAVGNVKEDVKEMRAEMREGFKEINKSLRRIERSR
jgi:uncharacterized membrane-anchored protein YhcB (DUF1043 family)